MAEETSSRLRSGKSDYEIIRKELEEMNMFESGMTLKEMNEIMEVIQQSRASYHGYIPDEENNHIDSEVEDLIAAENSFKIEAPSESANDKDGTDSCANFDEALEEETPFYKTDKFINLSIEERFEKVVNYFDSTFPNPCLDLIKNVKSDYDIFKSSENRSIISRSNSPSDSDEVKENSLQELKGSVKKRKMVMEQQTTPENKETENKPVPKSRSSLALKHLSNESIVKRSKLFRDLPSSSSSSPSLTAKSGSKEHFSSSFKTSTPTKGSQRPLTRTDRVFESVTKEMKQKQAEEAKIREFESRLSGQGSDDDDENNMIICESSPDRSDCETRLRKEICTSAEVHSTSKDVDEELNNSTEIINFEEEMNRINASENESMRDEASGIENNPPPDVECPLCSKMFPHEKVAHHAALCEGDSL